MPDLIIAGEYLDRFGVPALLAGVVETPPNDTLKVG